MQLVLAATMRIAAVLEVDFAVSSAIMTGFVK